nr:ATP-binding protein [Chloroflexota bacterium]
MSMIDPQTGQVNPLTQKGAFIPPPITKVGDTGLSQLWLQDLVLKVLYFQGYLTGFQIAEAVALPFAGV